MQNHHELFHYHYDHLHFNFGKYAISDCPFSFAVSRVTKKTKDAIQVERFEISSPNLVHVCIWVSFRSVYFLEVKGQITRSRGQWVGRFRSLAIAPLISYVEQIQWHFQNLPRPGRLVRPCYLLTNVLSFRDIWVWKWDASAENDTVLQSPGSRRHSFDLISDMDSTRRVE